MSVSLKRMISLLVLVTAVGLLVSCEKKEKERTVVFQLTVTHLLWADESRDNKWHNLIELESISSELNRVNEQDLFYEYRLNSTHLQVKYNNEWEDITKLSIFKNHNDGIGPNEVDGKVMVEVKSVSIADNYDVLYKLTSGEILLGGNLKFVLPLEYSKYFQEVDQIIPLEVNSDTLYKGVMLKQKDNLLGYGYHVKESNGFGYIDMLVILDPSGKIVAIDFLDFNQTPSYQAIIKARTFEFIGTKIQVINQSKADIDATAGGTSQGFNTVYKGLLEIKNWFPSANGDALSLVKQYFIEATSVKEVSVSSITIKKKIEIIKGSDVIGYYFVGSEYAEGIPGHDGKDELRISVVVDKSGKVINIQTEYSEHTESFVSKLNTFYNNAKNQNIADFKNIDGEAGASAYSMPVVDKVLTEIAKNLSITVKPMVPKDPYILVFGNYERKELDTEFEADDVLLSRELIYNDLNQVIGIAYVGTGKAVLHDYDETLKTFNLIVGLDIEGNFVGFAPYEHEHTTSYVDRLNPYFDRLLDVNVDAYEGVDDIAGATMTLGVIKAALAEIKTLHESFNIY